MSVHQYRHDLHQIPELGFKLPKTLSYVKNHLEKLRGTVSEPADSSLAIYFDNGQATTLAFRADMDGLPVNEDPTKELRSLHEGKMHACGHDGHMAMLLALCDYVNEHPRLNHNVLAIFQPAEEATGGAKGICDSGIFQAHNVNAVFGIHMWPGFAAGEIVSRRGELMARCSEVKVDIRGRSVHIAKADQGHDALHAATTLVNQTYEMVKQIPAGQHRLLKFGLLNSGTVCNVIAADAHLEGSMRAFNNDTYQHMKSSLESIATEIAKQSGCHIDLDIDLGYPPVINDGTLFDAVNDQIELPIILLPEPPMTGEDFSFYQQVVPGVFFFLGTGQDDSLHSQAFDFDESALDRGVELYKQLLELSLPTELD